MCICGKFEFINQKMEDFTNFVAYGEFGKDLSFKKAIQMYVEHPNDIKKTYN